MNIHPEDNTPCYGLHDLFDSTDLSDHVSARALCMTCPFIEACKKNTEACKTMDRAAESLDGTWAGDLYRSGRISTAYARDEVRRQEDAAYTRTEAARCAQAYSAGDRTDYVRIGRRVYDRFCYYGRLERRAGDAA